MGKNVSVVLDGFVSAIIFFVTFTIGFAFGMQTWVLWKGSGFPAYGTFVWLWFAVCIALFFLEMHNFGRILNRNQASWRTGHTLVRVMFLFWLYATIVPFL